MTDSHTVPHSSHWGAFDVTVRDGDIASVQPMHDPDPSPLLGNLPGSLRHPVRIETPVARRGWLERRTRADARSRQRFVRGDLVGRSARPRGRRAEARGRAARQSRDFRRLVRLGQRRNVPSEPEPAASFPESDRRFHRAPQQLQHRRVAGAAAASGRQLGDGIPSRHCVGRHRAAYRSDGGIRRFAVEKHVRRAGRQRPPSSAPASRCGAPPRHADRALLAVARRRGAGGAGALVSARAAERRRGDARPRSHARQRRSARCRVPRALLSRCRSVHRVRARPARRRREIRRVGATPLRNCGGRSARAGARDGRQAHADHRFVFAAARATRRATGVGGAVARGVTRTDRSARRRFRSRLRIDGRRRQRNGAASICRRCRKAAMRCAISFRWRESPICCCSPARRSRTTAPTTRIRTSASCIGRAATRFITIRI